VQDGFDLYLHSFVVASDGEWVVVQQGMNGSRKQAQSRVLECSVQGPSLDGVLTEERDTSHIYGGRSVFGWEAKPKAAAEPDAEVKAERLRA
jgi:Protein of unknown function (DUF763)